jgi:hypothetical protein
MSKYIIIVFFIFSTLNSYSQECGFDTNDSIIKSEKKMEWFVNKLTNQKLTITNDKNDIPVLVQKQLDCFTNGFDIANPNENYQSGCDAEEGVPSRHLNILAKNENYIMLNYTTYNLGVSGHNIWIKYNKNGITEFWTGSTMGGLIVDSNFDLNKYIAQTELHVKKMNEIFNGND